MTKLMGTMFISITAVAEKLAVVKTGLITSNTINQIVKHLSFYHLGGKKKLSTSSSLSELVILFVKLF